MTNNTNAIANWKGIEYECYRLSIFAWKYDPDNLNFWPLYIWKISSLVNEWFNAFKTNNLTPQYEKDLLEKIIKKTDEIITNLKWISNLSEEIKKQLPTYFGKLNNFKKLIIEENLKKVDNKIKEKKKK